MYWTTALLRLAVSLGRCQCKNAKSSRSNSKPCARKYSIVTVVSLLGICGARSAGNKIHNHEWNWWLIVYFVVVTIAFAMQVAAAALLFVLIGVIDDRDDQANESVQDLDRNIREWIDDHPDRWKRSITWETF